MKGAVTTAAAQGLVIGGSWTESGFLPCGPENKGCSGAWIAEILCKLIGQPNLKDPEDVLQEAGVPQCIVNDIVEANDKALGRKNTLRRQRKAARAVCRVLDQMELEDTQVQDSELVECDLKQAA